VRKLAANKFFLRQVFGFAFKEISDLTFKIMFSFHSGYLSVFPHNKYTDLHFVQNLSLADIPVMKYITSYMIRHRDTFYMEPL
jgi:hypothetical protein